MPVVCFRFVGKESHSTPSPARTDNVNSEIVERINASGRAYLTQTKLRGRTVMRIGFGNVLTTEEHLRTAWELIQKAADSDV
jgi:aromatic-L-amino-acid/L-tryptophan decarboxylase